MTAANEGLVYEEFVPVPMRDGTLLAASVTRPAGAGPFPTVLTRTPYDRTNQRANGEAWARAGYAFVRQDVRGRFDSQGEFWPFRDDPADGFDTIEWLAAQPWCDGRIGTTGASHVGTVQYLAAPTRPPHLVAAIPEFAPASVYDRWWYHGGAFRLGFNLAWIALLAQDNLRHFPARMAELNAAREQLWVTPERMRSLEPMPFFREWTPRDLSLVDGVFGNDWIARFMEHREYGEFWRPVDFTAQHAEMETPMLHIGGWHDTFCQGTVDSYVGMRAHARTAEARAAQRLIMGPWRHVNWGERGVGELDFGEGLLEVSPFETRRRWFDRWLRGDAAAGGNEPPVLIFVMGENRWRAEEEWPLARAEAVPFYLLPDGALGTRPPVHERALTFRYDPNHPVPTIGGCEWVNFPCGPFDQRVLDSRPDVLRFQTAPLDEDVEVTGQVFAHLLVSSSAPDTDLTAKLIDVHTDGRAFNVCDGIARVRHRRSREHPALLARGERDEVVVDLWSTSNLFRRGHRIRLDVSSSNFPRFAPNANTTAPAYSAPLGREERAVAENTVHLGGERGSRIVLPVVARRR
ncbi:MAG: CocE/NonD family hydrolase [Chloroflexi bacterium]|nr:CocE/NonD family hydrolase [Chloroflexota bacterium]